MVSMDRSAHALFSLTTSDRQRLVLGVMILPLAASCMIVSGFTLARVASASDHQRPAEVRFVLAERDRRVEGSELVARDDRVEPGDAGERLDDPPTHALNASPVAARAGLRRPGVSLDHFGFLSDAPPMRSGNPRAPPRGGHIG